MVSKRYDEVSEQLIDDNMCTEDVCPCLDYNHDESRVNPKVLYRKHLESYLEKYNRTNFDNSYWTKRGDVPLYFTENANKGFVSFMECLMHWEKKANKDKSIKLEEVFKVSESVYDRKPEFIAFDTNVMKNDGFNTMYLLNHRDEWSLYQFLEDEFNCSGICRPGLFYFDNPISYGPPESTCLNQFVKIVRDGA